MSQRVWVITGTNSGLGLSIAQNALSQGDKVCLVSSYVANARRITNNGQVIATVRSLHKFPDSLKSAGAHPLIFDANNSDEENRNAAEEAIRVYGHVDVLVNNAAIVTVAPVEELPYVVSTNTEFLLSYLVSLG